MRLTCLLYVVTFITQLIIIFEVPPCIVIYFKLNQIHYIHCMFSYVLTSQNRSVVVTRSTQHVVECASHTAVATSSAELHVARVAPCKTGYIKRSVFGRCIRKTQCPNKRKWKWPPSSPCSVHFVATWFEMHTNPCQWYQYRKVRWPTVIVSYSIYPSIYILQRFTPSCHNPCRPEINVYKYRELHPLKIHLASFNTGILY